MTRSPTGLTMTGLYDKYRLALFGEYLLFERELAPLGVKQLIRLCRVRLHARAATGGRLRCRASRPSSR